MKDKKLPNVYQRVKTTNNHFTAAYGRKVSRSLQMTGATITASTFFAIGKLAMGIIALSFFACANAFYSFGMIIAKGIALIGIHKANGSEEQCQYYSNSGVVLIISSLIYIIYSIRLFFSPISSYYDKYTAIIIAAVTFTEIGLGIRGVIVTKQNHILLIHAIKMINLSASIIALVLTQTALLSLQIWKQIYL